VTPHDSGLLELSQALSKYVRAEVRQSSPQVGEALRSEHELADDEQRPTLADQVQCPRYPARIPVAALYRHHRSLADQS
jgi:hypothetical protein